MDTAPSAWPEQNAVYAWAKKHGLTEKERPDDYNPKLHELARETTNYRLEVQRERDELKAELDALKTREPGEVSDGYHTFNELYEHRNTLFLAVMACWPERAWLSGKHHDGSEFPGWFIAGLDLPTGTVTYHMPNFLMGAAVNTGAKILDAGKPWDGHTSGDVLVRLRDWIGTATPGNPEIERIQRGEAARPPQATHRPDDEAREASAAMRTAIAAHLAEFEWMDGPEGWRVSCQKLREAAGGTLASPGANLIAAERLRQLTQEGWTPAHDDAHTRAELSGAAACYAIAANELASPRPYLNPPNISLWPWEMKWWKPGNDPVRCLVKAGALIAAEIDRLQRAEDYQRHVDKAAEGCDADDKPCDACIGFGVCDGPSQEGGDS